MSIIRSGSFPESVMLRHLKRLAHRQAERTQFGQRVLGIAMMHERPTGFFPEMPVLERVIDEDVASLGMAALVDSHAGDDLRAGKMLGNPALLLRLRPVSARAARQADWMEMRNCLEQVTRVRQQWQGGIEVARLGKPLPEGWQTMALLACARRHTEDTLGKIGRATRRYRVCSHESISVVAIS